MENHGKLNKKHCTIYINCDIAINKNRPAVAGRNLETYQQRGV